MIARDKYSSLLQTFINYGRITLGPEANVIKLNVCNLRIFVIR
jgi:hypothetical protein